MKHSGLVYDSHVIALTILLGGALLATTIARTNNLIDKSTDMSHLRQIGAAQLVYSESWGDSYTTRPLVVTGALARDILVSPSDRTKDGYANFIRDKTKSPLDPKTYYRDSYLPVSAVINQSGIARILPSTNAGWLVAFSGSDILATNMSQPCFSGNFLRLQLDGSVVVKKHLIAYNYPKKHFGPFQSMSWWFTDQYSVVEPGFNPPSDFLK